MGGPIHTGPKLVSWDQAHRLELDLRSRAEARGTRARGDGRCPACGGDVSEGEDGIRLGGLIVHSSCLFRRENGPPTAA